MLYELIRSDPACKLMPWLAILSAVAWAGPSPFDQVGVLLAMMGLFGAMPQQRANRFEAGMPIAARDLLLARALSLMAVVWIPALAGAAAVIAVKGFSALAGKPLAAAALCTLLAAVAQNVRLEELSAPQWTLFPLYLGLPVVGPLTVDQPAAAVPPLCAVAGVALFVRAWVAVPRSFHLGSVVPRNRETAAKTAVRQRAFSWAPVLRSIWSWQYAVFVGLMGLQTASGRWLLTPFWLFIAWVALRGRTRWLWALPIGRRALLWALIGPVLGAHVLGYVARVLRHKAPVLEPRLAVVTLSAILGWALLALFFCVLVDWRGFARVPRRVLTRATVSLVVIWYFVSVAALYLTSNGGIWTDRVLEQAARAAPLDLPALIALTAGLLVLLYGAVEKVFSEPDFADAPKAVHGATQIAR